MTCTHRDVNLVDTRMTCTHRDVSLVDAGAAQQRCGFELDVRLVVRAERRAEALGGGEDEAARVVSAVTEPRVHVQVLTQSLSLVVRQLVTVSTQDDIVSS